MEEIKKKNKNLKKIAIVLFIIIILLAGLEAFLYNEMKPVIDYSDIIVEIDFREVHNSPFYGFSGKQKGSSVKSLIQVVMSNNIQSGVESVVYITAKGAENIYEGQDLADLMLKDINSKEYYEVTMYQNEEGFIHKIFIRKEGESKTEEELNLEKTQMEYSKSLEEELYKQEEKMKKITIIVISILAIIGLILIIIKGLSILKKDDENKKRKVLISFITTESIIVGGLLLVLIGIMTGEIYYMF
ncbi:MAG: hypothetical protein IJN50_05735 [Clostridia bacterium]|nr:hypothetical protein [Clostridia bacterium]